MLSYSVYLIKNYPELEGLLTEAKRFFEGVDSPAHDWSHIERVGKLTIQILENEEVKHRRALHISVLLHDIKRKDEVLTGLDHAKEGAKLAGKLLAKHGFDEKTIEIVVDSIRSHRYSLRKTPKYPEGKILQDADRLDAIGAIAIARVFAHKGEKRVFYDPKIKPSKNYNGKSSTYLNHFFEKILKIDPDSFWTETARKLAERRHEFTLEYVKKFLREWYGLE
ncbi:MULTISPECIES: HD domain-containing protein [unclassified Kosmotoga]|uniref:Metal dependent phosphohydrolase n=1 Tax=Kosmotoga olearia (strain ATCC BAA-1733 / DSM 21960 / TBF 19.5.1) TaxID=521045 RepID=C5CG16_KOSOT|nr:MULTISPECIES: HD domain-containing protein [unclassified Kosmotoga]ACR79457.1 metal dependent phosphohydrolase [Kosmotoga olearia TBF 19.5.1]